ncbi:MAG: ribonuclease R [Candidatus Sumerlaeia bacterium]|nr:ribonuclease R [Candidatus Sumerlaeia bacterium]
MAGTFDSAALLAVLRGMPEPATTEELLRAMKLRPGHRRALRLALLELEEEGAAKRLRGERWVASGGGGSTFTGRLEMTRRGFGFVRLEPVAGGARPPFEGDVFIPPENTGDALHGDLVRVEVLRIDDRGPLGRVKDTLEHTHQRIAGWYQATRKGGRVMPRSQRIEREILTPPPDQALGIADFEWVVVEVTEFTQAPEPLRGRVVERLGADGDRGIDVLLLLRDRGIVEEFSPAAEAEANGAVVDWDGEMRRRTDYRELTTFTIDPVTAKDFDDALSIETLPTGWRLYVHIADPAHFMRMGGILDAEARERSTSVYPVDRVVPMLPNRLSSDLCSLRPGEDRLTLTAVIEFDRSGSRVRTEFHESAIRSAHRTNYAEIQKLLDGDDALRLQYEGIHDELRELLALTRLMRKRRFERGALNLDIPELEVVFDQAGRVADLRFYPRYESHQLIEECMLAANEAVADFLTERGAPLLYRIHEPADEDRLGKLEPVLRAFGIRLNLRDGSMTPDALQKAIAKAETMKGGHIVRRLILRALKRAEYSPRNAGHFGLASKCYCHFTSPIRRYPDVVVHRQLKALLRGAPLPYPADDDGTAELVELGRHTSGQEREAQEAEWEAQRIKALEYMKRHEGDEFDALIASVSQAGMFIELESLPVEGFAPVRTLRSDKYELDDLGIRLVGRNSGRSYKLGQQVRVQVLRSDPMTQELDLRVLEEDAFPPARRAPKRHGRRY